MAEPVIAVSKRRPPPPPKRKAGEETEETEETTTDMDSVREALVYANEWIGIAYERLDEIEEEG
jgi:hypothetical protein